MAREGFWLEQRKCAPRAAWLEIRSPSQVQELFTHAHVACVAASHLNKAKAPLVGPTRLVRVIMMRAKGAGHGPE